MAKVVRARGLPFSATKRQIAEFFRDSELKDDIENSVHIDIDQTGRPSGVGFIHLADEDSYQAALQMDKQNLGKRYIDVFPSNITAFKRSVQQSQANDCRVPSNVVRLRGLPFDTTDDQIREFFSFCNVVEMRIPRSSWSQCKGHGFVVLNSKEDTKKALELHMQCIGDRYIEIFTSSMEEMNDDSNLGADRYKPKIRDDKKRGKPYERPPPARGDMSRRATHNVTMRGIPFKATEGDIIKFFSPILPKMVEIHLEGGRRSGEATVEFNCHEDALQAMEKDKEYMGSRYIELFLESKPSVRPVPRRIPGRKNLMQDPPAGSPYLGYSRSEMPSLPYERSYDTGPAAVSSYRYHGAKYDSYHGAKYDSYHGAKYDSYEEAAPASGTDYSEYSTYDYTDASYPSTTAPPPPTRSRYHAPASSASSYGHSMSPTSFLRRQTQSYDSEEWGAAPSRSRYYPAVSQQTYPGTDDSYYQNPYHYQ